ncbi:MAG: succinate dehydrogenase membrane anchor subunit SdhD [Roseibaca calidilacus]|uniref:Succinate dehydrogenase hydrophobic membrane anchor subunit n=1 Tax=Roseibaca calidilacus TaxID=1666912 RepID=A0A0P7YMS6_9RHOB|nr:succinate dehydrogenase, hydrophobic membrane anchor protein [Roseibaca calidilacus]KPP89887.1 MAG: succinate dehydrogenase membrane anchor subunit SdhD [Roseibaca calidilacus]CUX80940.1 succinate dehydrogenase / fumarate reductase membrane anchor subunit [Roseibaca calidilacus]
MSFKSDYSRAHGHGAAGEGLHHWWSQRVTSIALIPLTLLFIFPFGRTLGGGHDAFVATYSNLWHALVAVLFIIAAFAHLQQGLQTVIEDYVPNKAQRTAALLINMLLCWALGAAGVLSVATVLFSA